MVITTSWQTIDEQTGKEGLAGATTSDISQGVPTGCPYYVRYLGPSDWSSNGGERTLTYQGGYYCSVRAWTAFENEDYVMDAPNFWSRYMDTEVECGGRGRTGAQLVLTFPQTCMGTE